MFNKNSLLTLGLLAVVATANALPEIDGTIEAEYGAAVAVQDTQTSFGDNFSELNGLYIKRISTGIYIAATGNLETNFNKFEIFIDSIAGGQNRLLFGQADTDFGALVRMAESTAGGVDGMIFDAGFAPDFWFGCTIGGSPLALYANRAPIGDAAFTNGYLGTAPEQGAGMAFGVLDGGNNPFGIECGINNANTAGVEGGFGLSFSASTSNNTGIEWFIPNSAFGDATGPVKVSVMINGGGHDFLSNQVLPGIGGGNHLGDPRFVDFSLIPNNQYYTIDPVSGGATVSGNVSFAGLGGYSNLMVQFRNAGTQTNVGGPISVPVDGSGNFSVAAPGNADYDITVAPVGFLRRTVNANTTGGNVSGLNLVLVGGDFDANNTVDISDYLALSESFDTTSSDSNWTTPNGAGVRPVDLDIDLSGSVDLGDYLVMSAGFDQTGDN